MQQIHFLTVEELNIFLKKYIDQIRGIGEVNGSLLAGYIKEETREMELPDWEDRMLGLMIPQYRYVIKNEDLTILESLFDGLKAAAGANFFMSVSAGNVNEAYTGAIGIFSTLYKIYKNIKNKGKVLPSLEFQVLLCLKNHPEGLEFEYLQFLLEQDNVISGQCDLRQLLEDLGKIYMHDGSKKELVIKEGNLYKTKGI